jgi:hypothetical protein
MNQGQAQKRRFRGFTPESPQVKSRRGAEKKNIHADPDRKVGDGFRALMGNRLI